MLTRYFANNSSTTIVSDNGSNIVVQKGFIFPTQFPFFVTAENASLQREIIRVDSKIDANTWGVTRAQEGSTQIAFSAGNRIEQRVTAQLLNDVVAGVNASIVRSGDTMSGALNFAPSVSLESSATTTIGVSGANNISITGTATITSFGISTVGTVRFLTFAGTPTLTHNATSLVLPSRSNIVTASGDTAIFESLGSGNWRCLVYQRASGSALVQPASGVTSFNGRTGAVSPTTSDVSNPYAGNSWGGIGTYAWLSPFTGGGGWVYPNAVWGGGSLIEAATGSYINFGTWKCYGTCPIQFESNGGPRADNAPNLWMRIA